VNVFGELKGDVTTPYSIEQMPVVDQSADAAELASQALEYVRRVGIRPWEPAAEPVFYQPTWRQHANTRTTPDMVFGQYLDGAPAYLPLPDPWRLVNGTFLLSAMSGSGKAAAAWMAAHTSKEVSK
jgi:hypothetical protein